MHIQFMEKIEKKIIEFRTIQQIQIQLKYNNSSNNKKKEKISRWNQANKTKCKK